MIKFTVVQHSGYGYGKDPMFRRGLEPRQLETEKEQKRVEEAGGVLFDSYLAADEFANAEMFPNPDAFTMVPRAAGSFSNRMIDDLHIYIPIREVTG